MPAARTLVLVAIAWCSLVGATRVVSQDTVFTVASYNIRHGRGMDGVVNLQRTGEAIARLGADIVALQEVDKNVERSGRVDEPQVLGSQLRMEYAFGAFMPYQGGEYGMGMLSRFPIRRMHALRLPDGNEPRVALMVEVELPNARRVLVVNVHFDWVANDTLRYAQVAALGAVLDTVSIPIVLLGDFNDQPDSRTLTRWQQRFRTVEKPASDRFTFSSTEPKQEIDHILLAPVAAWGATTARVMTDTLTSDHRPVVARVQLRAR
ncbi:MAG: endonuclease/exonuclease/phosphatase family protein [Gemmatimonadaceae bacterium]|nr:endonuclease/exonuclease/phosphatase family protein [Gemmatimonadaceae bacterium]